MTKIDELLELLKAEIKKIPDIDDKVEALNHVRKSLSEVSPFKNEPVDCVQWIKQDKVQANDYNPNKVAGPELNLLHTSIKEDGYTQPIVAFDLRNGRMEVVDGFHRNRIGKEHQEIKKRIYGYLPISLIEKPLDERMASTVRHNRARGTHQIKSMSAIVLELTKRGWDDKAICKELGMELDEVIRLKQITGLMEAFQNHEFSKSWNEFRNRHYSEDKE